MWENNWREDIWQTIQGPWDLLIVGGGITGAGILREATRLGLKGLLVEQRDFAWGTSSRSSKLVHGGFRYLKEGKIRFTRQSVQERDYLVHDGPGLIDPLGFLLTIYKGDFPGRLTFEMGLTVYDLLAMRWDHRYFSPQDFQFLAPHINQDDLQGGFRFGDAQTDDSRLTLRVIHEAVAEGATAINYVKADNVIFEDGHVKGVLLRDVLNGKEIAANASVVVNATGAWADVLRKEVGGGSTLRPLRGSHLIFPSWCLPVAQAVSFLHPFDNRPVFIFPWEGVTLVGTTDVDHEESLDKEPKISAQEVSYLMAAVEHQFPSLNIGLDDVISTYAGVRPVISHGKLKPSEESREHAISEEKGLVTVTGGKLTTFRLIGLDVLHTIQHHFPNLPDIDHNIPVLDPVDQKLPGCDDLSDQCRRRLLGRLGKDAIRMAKSANPAEMEAIPGTNTLWAEVRWAARSEGVCHLDDLLLRRTRLGLILPKGGEAILPAVKEICMAELHWDKQRWQKEVKDYRTLWNSCYSLPSREAIPVWMDALSAAYERQKNQRARRRMKAIRHSSLTAAFAIACISLMTLFWRRSRRKQPTI